jgi:hypothetical protein
MNSGTTLIGIIALAICIIPIFLLRIKNRRKEQVLKNALFAEAEKKAGVISQYDIWAETMIGIDQTAGMLFFLRKGKIQSIRLSDVEQCRLLNTSRTEQNNRGNYTVIDLLALIFVLKNTPKSEIQFEFYNAESDSLILSEELQLVEKWHKLIQKK